MTLDQVIKRAGRQYLRKALRENGYNMAATARAVRRNRSDLYKVLRRFGVDRNPPRVVGRQMTPSFRRFVGLHGTQRGMV